MILTVSTGECELSIRQKQMLIQYLIGFIVIVETKEPDAASSIIGLITNAVDHIYYPVEKICWLAEHKCLDVEDPNRWDTISSIFWVSSIYLNLMR